MKFGLVPKIHPNPYSIIWVDQSIIPITHRYQVPIQLASYQGQVWCDIAIVAIADVLLGCPWFI